MQTDALIEEVEVEVRMNKRKKREMSCLRYVMWMVCHCMLTTIGAQVTKELKAVGMENIQCVQTAEVTTVSFENNVYRSTYSGVGKAVEACLKGHAEGSVQLVVLENRTPRLCISLPDSLTMAYRNGEVSLLQVYERMGISVDTDKAMEALKGAEKTEASSAWKVDVVVYPDLFLENNTFDELYTYAVNLNPALEMNLWKGAKLMAQVVLPIATNLSGEMSRVRPGIITLSQLMRFKHNFFAKLSVGNFTDNRYGAQWDMKYRTDNGRWELGATVGSTGFSAVTREEGWYIGRKQRVNASLNASFYEPRTNLQFDLKAGRYIYGDFGVRGDCTRHFGEYAIGLYALCTDGEVNGGFHFAIPLPGKKWSRKGAFRVKPADYFAWSYAMVAHGKYVDEQMGSTYKTQPNENRSSQFYQPDYIRYFLMKELLRKKS